MGGFNRTWGLELPQAMAVRGGSVLVLRARQPIALADLLAVERAGLGERRAEGFGRVAFFGALEPRPAVQPPATDRPVEKPARVPETVRRMERRLLDDALEARLLEVAAERVRGVDAKRLPSPSLLARLRGPLRAGPEGLGRACHLAGGVGCGSPEQGPAGPGRREDRRLGRPAGTAPLLAAGDARDGGRGSR